MLFNNAHGFSWTLAGLYASLLQNQKLNLIKVASWFVRFPAVSTIAAPFFPPFQSLTHFKSYYFAIDRLRRAAYYMSLPLSSWREYRLLSQGSLYLQLETVLFCLQAANARLSLPLPSTFLPASIGHRFLEQHV